MKPLLYDLCCGQMGAGWGYHEAGFRVIGFDLHPQPRAPLEFRQADVLEVLKAILRGELERPDAFHASCPCQRYSGTQVIQGREHPDLIPAVRELMRLTGIPYVMENVKGAPLLNPIELCGTMFNRSDRGTYRERLFETSFPVDQPDHPLHLHPQTKMGRPPKPGEWIQCVGNFSDVAYGREAMRMPWANRDGLREAIPPYYTKWMGARLREHLEGAATRLSGVAQS
jgi:DNA (cytosine-5)-methyltransferase 1